MQGNIKVFDKVNIGGDIDLEGRYEFFGDTKIENEEDLKRSSYNIISSFLEER